MKSYYHLFDVNINGVNTLYKVVAVDYDEGLARMYESIKRNNLLHCYRRQISLCIKYLGQEEIEEVSL